MPASVDFYSHNHDTVFQQTRRMSGPYIPHTSNTSISNIPRRYSVQTDGSPFLTPPPTTVFPPNQQPYSQQKPALRNVLSAPPNQFPNPTITPMSRRDSLKSQSADSTSNTELARYKTELCRPYEETGQCRYGAKCQFAHGSMELRVLNRHPKYKTELCRTYHSTGFCSYGQRCNFIHTEEPRRMSASGALPCPKMTNTAFNSRAFPKILPFDFPLSINSTGDSPASSVDGCSPSHSPAYLNDDVFSHAATITALRYSPTPSFGSEGSSGASIGNAFPSPPGTPQHIEESDMLNSAQLQPSPLDIGLEVELCSLRL